MVIPDSGIQNDAKEKVTALSLSEDELAKKVANLQVKESFLFETDRKFFSYTVGSNVVLM